jgi:hypothetical protein
MNMPASCPLLRVLCMINLIPLRTFWWGVLHAIGMFGLQDLTNEEKIVTADQRAWFSLGEVVMAGFLAGSIAVPAGLWFATRTELPPAFIGTAVLFLPLFVFLPRLVRSAMAVDTDAVLEAFGKNDQVKKVFWTLFITTAGLVLTDVLDPAMAHQIVGILAGLVP